ncbi:hypothetical protein PG999_006214 [Apiospora kogelbergensis]|uniref:Uncharacterized protein n=1 Tax=Apiospora kogelbergensis TaxID=1337665 RepID=A0AAW0QQ49_9PEZI
MGSKKQFAHPPPLHNPAIDSPISAHLGSSNAPGPPPAPPPFEEEGVAGRFPDWRFAARDFAGPSDGTPNLQESLAAFGSKGATTDRPLATALAAALLPLPNCSHFPTAPTYVPSYHPLPLPLPLPVYPQAGFGVTWGPNLGTPTPPNQKTSE